MAYSNECPNCGANLDPNEVCDCTENTEEIGVTENVQLCNIKENENGLFCVS